MKFLNLSLLHTLKYALEGLTLPVSVTSLDKLCLVAAHGLGSVNPASKSHLNDEWVDLLLNSSQSVGMPALSYTARGHGGSFGWESSAETDPSQFTWENLSYDMRDVCDYFEMKSCVVSGSSMGSATALFAAVHFPEKVSGLIMIRPPTAWEDRLHRRKNLLSSAKKCQVGCKDNCDDIA